MMRQFKQHFNCSMIVFFFVSMLFPFTLQGQMTARGLGMGGAYMTVARGVHASDYNPANLGLPDNSKFSMTFISTEVGVWNNTFTKNMYDKYFVEGADPVTNQIFWTASDIENILDAIPNDGLDLNTSVAVRALSFSVGRFAFSVRAIGRTFLRLDKTFFEIPLTGTELGKSYGFSNTDGKGIGVGLMSFSWGQPVQVSFADHFAVGGTFHLIYGGGYAQADYANLKLDNMSYGVNLDGDFKATYALGKMGWGMDIGAAAQMGEKWTVGASLSQLVGSIPWSEEIKTVEGFIQGDSINVENGLDEDKDFDSEEIDGIEFSAKLPAVFRVGCSYREGDVLLSADYYQCFKEHAWANTKPRLSVGTEWQKLKWLPLRMGVILGGRMGFGTSFGFGFRFGSFIMDFGIMNKGFISPNNSKGIIAAFGMGIDLQPKSNGPTTVGDFINRP